MLQRERDEDKRRKRKTVTSQTTSSSGKQAQTQKQKQKQKLMAAIGHFMMDNPDHRLAGYLAGVQEKINREADIAYFAELGPADEWEYAEGDVVIEVEGDGPAGMPRIEMLTAEAYAKQPGARCYVRTPPYQRHPPP